MFVFTGFNGSNYSAWVNFDISSLPACSVVDSVETQFGMNGAGNAGVTQTIQINDVTGAHGLYGAYNAAAHADLTNGTYTTFDATGPGTYGYYYLGTAANVDLMNDMPLGEFQVGLHIVSPTDWKRFSAELCYLRVTYHNGTSSSSVDTLMGCDSLTWIDGITYTANNSVATHTLTDAFGCDSLVTLNLTMNYGSSSVDTIIACDSVVWIDGNTYGSSNSSATFTMTSSSGCDSTVYLDLTIGMPTVSVDTVSACGAYTWIDSVTYSANNTTAQYVLTNSNGCDSVVSLNLTIIPLPSVGVNQVGTNLTANTSNASYQWFDCDNNNVAIQGAANQSFIPAVTGNYGVAVTLGGCTDSSSCYLVDYTSLNELNAHEISVYPNPSQDGQFIITTSGNIETIRFVDVLGRKVDVNTNLATGQIDAANLAPGKYFLLVDIDAVSYVKEVVITQK